MLTVPRSHKYVRLTRPAVVSCDAVLSVRSCPALCRTQRYGRAIRLGFGSKAMPEILTTHSCISSTQYIMRDRSTDVFPSLKEMAVSFDMARYLQMGAVVASGIMSPIALGPGSLSTPPHAILVQLGQVHSSSTTSSFGNSLRLLAVHKVDLRGASLIHCVTNLCGKFDRTFRNFGPIMMASPGPRAPVFRVRSQPHVGVGREVSGTFSVSRITLLFPQPLSDKDGRVPGIFCFGQGSYTDRTSGKGRSG